jgi:ABC-type uncharacterized transport system substrate-binding protein
MINRIFHFTLGAVLFALCFSAEAQPPKKIPRIGFLASTTASSELPRLDGFRRGLQELGYTEGQNITIEYRFGEGDPDRLPALAAELVRLGVDVIVTGGPTATRPAKQATNTIPIVMTQDSDPVSSGFVASLARPGGNITGLVTISLSGKRLELLKEVVPKISQVAVLWNPPNPGSANALKETKLTAQALGVKLQPLEVRKLDDFDGAFRAVTKSRAGALMTLGDPLSVRHRAQILDFAARNKLPAMYHRAEFVEDGGLMTYDASRTEMARRAAIYVDKILKGTKPADIPVEQPMKFEFIINLKAAKQIGLTIPPNALARADRVIR